MVKLLKKVEVSYLADKKGTTCLHVAIMRGHMHIAEFLLKRTSKNALNESASPTAGKNLSKEQQEKEEKKQIMYIRQTNKAITWE